MERGWWLGAEDFRQERLTRVEVRPGPSRFGEEVQKAEAARAGRSVAEGLQRLGWSEADLAERLQMGSRGQLAQRRLGNVWLVGEHRG